jgi:hypothetical protein
VLQITAPFRHAFDAALDAEAAALNRNQPTDLVCLSADGLIMAEAAFPHGARGGPGEKEPTGLNRQCLRKRWALQPPEENGDRAK